MGYIHKFNKFKIGQNYLLFSIFFLIICLLNNISCKIMIRNPYQLAKLFPSKFIKKVINIQNYRSRNKKCNE